MHLWGEYLLLAFAVHGLLVGFCVDNYSCLCRVHFEVPLIEKKMACVSESIVASSSFMSFD